MLAQETVDYDVATPFDAEEIARLLATAFSESEPPAVAMGLTLRDLQQFLQRFAPRAITDGLTLVARSRDTGKLAGVLLTDDFASPPALDLNQISKKFLPIFSMLETLDEQFRGGRTILAGEFLHLYMLGVDRQLAGRGIAQGLVKACLDNGFRRGYQMAVTEATGRVSQRVFRKQGFEERFKVSYQDFMYDDKVVFASIQGHENAILMDKSLVQSPEELAATQSAQSSRALADPQLNRPHKRSLL
jgi:ribosomal protein S18 acetylase RimI-like enzyme